MEIKRDYYLDQLISGKDNGLIKVITGMRRCGKTHLLFVLFRDYLLERGIKEEQIIGLSLDETLNVQFREPLKLALHIRKLVKNTRKKYYVFLDGMQAAGRMDGGRAGGRAGGAQEILADLYAVLPGLFSIQNADFYLTWNDAGLTDGAPEEVRGMLEEVHVNPFCYSELIRYFGRDSEELMQKYLLYGGLPQVLALTGKQAKEEFLIHLLDDMLIPDVLEKHEIHNDRRVPEKLLQIMAAATGLLTNPKRISEACEEDYDIRMNQTTVGVYQDFFRESFLVNRSFRFDIKKRKRIGTPLKYYLTDVGLKNALQEFLQQENDSVAVMENIIYNELVIRGWQVDTGMVEYRYRTADGKEIRDQLEVDFIATRGDAKMYLQTFLGEEQKERLAEAAFPLKKINNSFRKTVVVREPVLPWTDDEGICYVGIREFLAGKYPGMEMV